MPNSAAPRSFVEQQRGDQESAEHEEDVDSEETAGDAGNPAVFGENECDSDRTDAVQCGDGVAAIRCH